MVGLVLGLLLAVLVSSIGALLALRTFFYWELGLTKNEVRTAVKHLSYEPMPRDDTTPSEE